MIMDITPEYLIPVIGVELTKKLMQQFRGCRVYIPKCASEHIAIQEDYKQMNCTNPQKIKKLSQIYEKSESQIRNIVKKKSVLFDEY